MIKTLLIAAVLVISALSDVKANEKFFNAIHQVESSGRTGRILGDGGRALGPLQIHRGYFRDAAAIDRSLGTDYNKVTDLSFAKRVVAAYLRRYAPTALKNNDYQTLARVHNGGPNGHRNPATIRYWMRVKKALN